MRKRLVLLCCALVLVGCVAPKATPRPTIVPTPTPGCDPAGTVTFLNEYDKLISEWDDTFALANSTARMSLPPLVQDLQDIKRRVGELETPCKEAEDLQAATTTYMNFVVSAFLSFLENSSDTEVKGRMDQASETMAEAAKFYVALESYAPQ